MKLSSHGAKAIEAVESNRSTQTDFVKQNIWFNWGDDTKRTIRLVGDFKWSKTHWIGKSNFGPDVPLFAESVFKGENKLPNKVNCSNWNVDTETNQDNGCVICRIAENANKYLQKQGKNLDEDTKKWLKDLQAKCTSKNAYYFLCIDRSDPYIAEGEKGFKIIQMSLELLTAITELDKALETADICSDDEGIDIVIKREQALGKGGKGRTKYSASPVFEKTSVKQTPLTEEERSWNRIDLSKFLGKNPDDTQLVKLLKTNVKDVWEEGDENEENNNAPF